MITYSKSFDTLIDAEAFLDTLLLKEAFEIAKVAYVPHDIYFVKPKNEQEFNIEERNEEA